MDTTKTIIFVLILLCLMLSCGCAGGKKGLEANYSDAELFEAGLKEFNNKNYLKARMYFNRIESYFPQSSYIQKARLLRADSHYKEDSISGYIEAQAEYQTFLNLYPTADNLDYIQFQIAMCSYKQIRAPDRDNKATLKAFKEFSNFLERYPNSELIDEANKYFQNVSDRLAEHEYQIGLFYFKRKKYLAVIDRFNFSLREYPSSLMNGNIHFYLGKSHFLLGNKKIAQTYLTQLVEKFPQCEFVPQAKEILNNIGNDDKPS